MDIIPSILVDNPQELLSQLQAATGIVSQVQVDIADGCFVSSLTPNDPELISQVSGLDIELHLMVANPMAEISRWTGVRAIKRILFHYESAPGQIISVCQAIIDSGRQAGLVINPNTDWHQAIPFLPKIQSLMFMGVYPGKQGQGLIPEVLSAITECRQKFPSLYLELDGGVNLNTLPQIIPTRVSAICPGSAIFKQPKTPAECVAEMQQIIRSLTSK